MQRKIVCLTTIAMMVLFVGCSNQMEDALIVEESSAVKQAIVQNPNDPWGESLKYDQIDVDSYIAEHADIFGNVLVFDSFDDVDDLLLEMEQMNYKELRLFYDDLQIEKCFHNDIIESNIYYDSIYVETGKEFGYDLLTDNVEIENDNFFETLQEHLLLQEENNLLAQHDVIDVDEVNSIRYSGVCLEPIAALDIYSLLNSKHIVVIDKVVHFALEEAWITMPITKYHIFAEQNFPDLRTLNAYLADGQLTGLKGEDFVISVPTTSTAGFSAANERTQRVHTGSNGRYVLTVEVSAYDTWAWFMKTARCGQVKISTHKWTIFNTRLPLYTHVEGSAAFLAWPHIEEPQRAFGIVCPAHYVRGVHFERRKVVYNTHIFWPQFNVYPYGIYLQFTSWKGMSVSYL